MSDSVISQIQREIRQHFVLKCTHFLTSNPSIRGRVGHCDPLPRGDGPLRAQGQPVGRLRQRGHCRGEGALCGGRGTGRHHVLDDRQRRLSGDVQQDALPHHRVGQGGHVQRGDIAQDVRLSYDVNV